MKKGCNRVIVLLGAVGLLLLTIILYYFGAFYPSFTKVSQKEFKIPGLSEDFVPQGLDYIEEKKMFLVSGYNSKEQPSKIYLISEESGEVMSSKTIKNTDGSDYTEHAGGITHYGDNLWVVGDGYLNHFKLSSLFDSSTEFITIQSRIQTGNGCDFVSVYNNSLIVGEFYKKDKFDTSVAHKVELGDEKANYALGYIYSIDGEKQGGVDDLEAVLSLPEKVQGLTLSASGKIVLSTSFSIPDSKLLVYKNVFNEKASGMFNIQGKDIPLYILDETKLEKKLTMPTMSEELVLVGDKVFVLFESACNKYKFINRTRIKNVYSLEI